jgi:hypothetical protein
MARLIEKPTVIAAVGNKPKRIEEFVGQVNMHTVHRDAYTAPGGDALSIRR